MWSPAAGKAVLVRTLLFLLGVFWFACLSLPACGVHSILRIVGFCANCQLLSFALGLCAINEVREVNLSQEGPLCHNMCSIRSCASRSLCACAVTKFIRTYSMSCMLCGVATACWGVCALRVCSVRCLSVCLRGSQLCVCVLCAEGVVCVLCVCDQRRCHQLNSCAERCRKQHQQTACVHPEP